MMRERRNNDLQPVVERYFAHPTPANLEAVVLTAMPLVHSIIEKLTIPDNLLAAREDLENIGVLGLLHALNKYDLEYGTPFISYAYGRVRGSVIDFLRSIDVFSQRRRCQFGLAQHTLVVLRKQQEREPPDQDVADYLGLSLKKYHALLTDAKGRFPLSLYENAEDQQPVLETVPDRDALAAFDQIDRVSLQNYVEVLVNTLPKREQDILALYFYEGRTMREIGQIMEVSEARISQILQKTLSFLRTHLKSVRVGAA